MAASVADGAPAAALGAAAERGNFCTGGRGGDAAAREPWAQPRGERVARAELLTAELAADANEMLEYLRVVLMWKWPCLKHRRLAPDALPPPPPRADRSASGDAAAAAAAAAARASPPPTGDDAAPERAEGDDADCFDDDPLAIALDRAVVPQLPQAPRLFAAASADDDAAHVARVARLRRLDEVRATPRPRELAPAPAS